MITAAINKVDNFCIKQIKASLSNALDAQVEYSERPIGHRSQL